jgi:oxygen-independent coproporphyrinogen-3 oxidase
MATNRAAGSPDSLDLERVLAVLGPAAAVSYAPPNIYPMSAPRFTPDSGAERPHPDSADVGIYVHVPFCSYHCTFCFYATRIGADLGQMRRYVDGLLGELEWVPEGSRLSQLYVGGGTPTALPPELLARVLAEISRKMASTNRQVHTVEASPETLTREHVEMVKAHGIERVSMGVQSLSDEVLGAVKRRHTVEMVEASCRLLLDAGLMVNVDLIYGLPGQTPDSFRHDFTAITALGVQSVTAYNLRVNERTPVARSLVDDERLDLARLVRWRSAVARVASELGFTAARWHTFQRLRGDDPAAKIVRRFDDVTGRGNQFSIGMSARSRLENVIYRNHASFDTYLERIESGGSPVEEKLVLSEHERRLRFLALTLGDGEALARAAYEAEFGTSVDDDFWVPLARLSEAGLIDDGGAEIRLSETGRLVYDLVTRAFYPENVRRWIEDRQSLAATAAHLRPRAR